MAIYNSLFSLIGNTPILNAERFAKAENINAVLLAKLEYFNPAGSVKDRVAKNMIEQAEAEGKLKKGYTIIEPTSGNTGIGLAAVGSAKGYKVIIIMPDNMSAERRSIIKAYGAEIILTDGAKGMAGAIQKAEELAATLPNALIAGQFTNPANPSAHFASTGPEIWEDTQGEVEVLVAGVGTGGTITGAGKYLKSKNPAIKVIAVEPESSPVLSKGTSGAHKIQGIGAGFVPKTLDTDIYDEVITVSDKGAYAASKKFAQTEGILVGVSSGAALHAAVEIAGRKEYIGKKIAVILPDSGERYLSVNLFE